MDEVKTTPRLLNSITAAVEQVLNNELVWVIEFLSLSFFKLLILKFHMYKSQNIQIQEHPAALRSYTKKAILTVIDKIQIFSMIFQISVSLLPGQYQ